MTRQARRPDAPGLFCAGATAIKVATDLHLPFAHEAKQAEVLARLVRGACYAGVSRAPAMMARTSVSTTSRIVRSAASAASALP